MNGIKEIATGQECQYDTPLLLLYFGLIVGASILMFYPCKTFQEQHISFYAAVWSQTHH
jgi:hypothetical protein